MCSSLPFFQCSNNPALASKSPANAPPHRNQCSKGLRLLGLTLSQERFCLFITVNSSPEVYDSQVLGRGHFVPGPSQARGRCSPGVLERQCGHWGHMVLNPGQLMTCAGSRPTTLPVLAQEACGTWEGALFSHSLRYRGSCRSAQAPPMQG